MVENMEIDTFHSIPYRRDGLPECPINLYNNDIGMQCITILRLYSDVEECITTMSHSMHHDQHCAAT